MKKLFKYLFLLSTTFSLIGCNNSGPQENKSVTLLHNTEFNRIDVKITRSELDERGLKFGDSVDFTFSNGIELKDVPYYDGFYCKKGDYVFCMYPTYEYPALVHEFVDDLYVTYELDENSTVEITLNEAAKYKDVQDTLGVKYSNVRSEYESDEIFANYRSIELGSIKKDKLYRSASPIDNTNNRADYVSSLIARDNIEYIFDLSNTSDKHAEYAVKDTTSNIWKQIYNDGHVYDVKVDANFNSESYYPKMKILAEQMADASGKILFHCQEGKDRTGFVAILLEALCGASFDEIANDYLVTYENYYHITKDKNPKQYQVLKELKLYEMTDFIVGSEVGDKATKEQLQLGAKSYLKTCGVSDNTINNLISNLSD